MHPCTKFCLVLFVFSATFFSLDAQSRKKDDKDKEPSRIGFGANLGNIAFSTNTFQFGLSPNIAYKLAEPLAVGLMVKLDYYYIKYPQYALKFSSFDIGPTAFMRWKPLFNMDSATPFLQGLFLQAEYERAYISRPATDEFGNIIINGNRIVAERNPEDYLYIGLGAASGYPFSTFVSIHYNIIDDFDHSRLPFNYRIGFTYNY